MAISHTGAPSRPTIGHLRPSHGGYPEPARWASWAWSGSATSPLCCSYAPGAGATVDVSMDTDSGNSSTYGLEVGEQRSQPQKRLLHSEQSLAIGPTSGASPSVCISGVVIPPAKRLCQEGLSCMPWHQSLNPQEAALIPTPWGSKRSWDSAFS
eukprot:TRINITY_DN64661_c0_g1_i1.p1 TRINITY_DN64661_c0_g1~~TRINITY_DN64661_c0_g1_i1.p1  ORF type:complete len:154 (-),score=15.88 TRINITY_DN64661_c0_g1_i1:122-583(-)